MTAVTKTADAASVKAHTANIERLLDETEKSLDGLRLTTPTGDAIRFDLPTWDGIQAPHVAHAPPKTPRQQLDVLIELGRAAIDARDAEQLCDGSVVTLDRGAQDLVDVYVGKNLVARGEVQVMNGHFCVRVAELIPRTNVVDNRDAGD
ncbi:MAG TPA: FliM/FliN family flagellar motor switch protein [Pirellulales bacterium]|jgi:flagellar motor switch protein FliN|nr:FliM/FliN family flagellar motor switch protein [Pirellulales bacterium]